MILRLTFAESGQKIVFSISVCVCSNPEIHQAIKLLKFQFLFKLLNQVCFSYLKYYITNFFFLLLLGICVKFTKIKYDSLKKKQ